jgi:hypothetical protein
VLIYRAMKGLTAIVIVFAVMAYDVSYNGGALLYGIESILGLR